MTADAASRLSIAVEAALGPFLLQASLEVDAEPVALVGPNGSGKTSLLLAILGLLKLDRGRIALGPVVTPVSQTVTLALPGPMDGTWTLGLELAPFGATAVGSATLTLSNGVAHHLAVTGKARGATTTLTLSGLPMNPAAKDIRIMATIEAAKTPLPPLFFLSGRGYGQRVGRLGVGDAGQ